MDIHIFGKINLRFLDLTGYNLPIYLRVLTPLILANRAINGLRNTDLAFLQPWELTAANFVNPPDQRFYPVANFPDPKPVFPQLSTPTIATPTFPDVLRDLGTIFLIGAGIYVALGALASLLAPQYNDEPLTRRDRNHIRARDGEICFYCTTYAPDGHVDHRVSRANGGSNDYDNLAWACAPCNLSKGALNDSEFMALFQ
jgi:hypothetical protein